MCQSKNSYSYSYVSKNLRKYYTTIDYGCQQFFRPSAKRIYYLPVLIRKIEFRLVVDLLHLFGVLGLPDQGHIRIRIRRIDLYRCSVFSKKTNSDWIRAKSEGFPPDPLLSGFIRHSSVDCHSLKLITFDSNIEFMTARLKAAFCNG